MKVDKFPKFLLDSGLSFEINRRILHPLGLSFVIDYSRESGKKKLDVMLIKTDDPEGYMYDEEGFNVGFDKYEKFLQKEGQEKLNVRKSKYGFIEQEIADVEEVKEETIKKE